MLHKLLYSAASLLLVLSSLQIAKATPKAIWAGVISTGGRPIDVMVHPQTDQIYISESVSDRIHIYNTNLTLSSIYGTSGSANGQLNSPWGITCNPVNEYIYVCDVANQRVQIFDSNMNYQSQLGTTGVSGNTSTRFYNASAIIYNPLDQNMYLPDNFNNTVKVYNSSNVYQGAFGSAGSGNGQLNKVHSLDIHPVTNNISTADYDNNRIQVFNGIAEFIKV